MAKHAKHAQKRRKRSGWWRTALLCLSIAGLLVSGFMLLYELVIVPGQNAKATNKYQNLHSRPESVSTAPSDPGQGGDEVLEEFSALLNENDDIGGWLTVPNTELNHPVFYTPEDQNYYLKRDANGNANRLGSLFLSAGSTLSPQADALVMYGHNMEDSDDMFGQLLHYESLDFLRKNPVVTFDTIYRRGEWKIIAVCRASVGAQDDGFDYYRTDYGSSEEFDAFIREARTRSLYNIRDDVAHGDSLLVLSTCEYAFWGDRFVIIARRLRENETVDTISAADYEKNPVTLMPSSYYELDYVHETPPAKEAIEENYRNFYGE